MTDTYDRDLQPSEDEPELDPLNPEESMSRIETEESAADEATLGVYAGDGGDLFAEPVTGDTDDPLVAVEEGVPYVPPSDRVLSDVRSDEADPTWPGRLPLTRASSSSTTPSSSPARAGRVTASFRATSSRRCARRRSRPGSTSGSRSTATP